MDFTKHDARTAAESIREVHLRDPATGEYIMDGDKHCSVLIVGSQSRSVQAGIIAETREKLRGAKKAKKTQQAAALEDAQRSMVEGASRVIRGFKNIERNDEPLTTSREDLEWFLDLNFLSVKSIMAKDDDEDEWLGDSFAQQILKAADDTALFLGE